MSSSSNSVCSLCSETFNCTPLQLNALRGDAVWVTLTGTLNGPNALLADFQQPSSPGCTYFGSPRIANAFMLPLGSLTLASETVAWSANGCRNGGFVAIEPALPIASALSSFDLPLQGIALVPLSPGGTGVAFSRAVVLTIP